MNEREIAEVRRTLRPERSTIPAVYGCYVNAEGQIIAKFCRSFALMGEEESEKYLAIFRRVLTGTPYRNLIDIPFSNSQVAGGEEHGLLMTLRKTRLEDESARDTFFSRVAASVPSEDNLVILLGCAAYDVVKKQKDGEDAGDSTEMYTYLVSAICPVKSTKSTLSYNEEEKSFADLLGTNAITPPTLGFLFPAFDGRQTNIYNALLYTKSLEDSHEAFTDAIFKKNIPMPAKEQGKAFRAVLADTLEEECTLPRIRAIHEELRERILVHKETKNPEPLTVSVNTVREVLSDTGIGEEKLEAFTARYTEEFGSGYLSPKNLVEASKFELRTPDVKITVAPGASDRVSTREIGGVTYLLIRADGGVELNGLDVRLAGTTLPSAPEETLSEERTPSEESEE